MVVSWNDSQDNGLPSTSSPNVYMLYASYPVAGCNGTTFPVWIRLPMNYNNQKRCSTILMYEANCYFDKSRCTQGYEYHVDDQLNRMETTDPDRCFIAFLFGSPDGQSNHSCPSINYLQSTKDVFNRQVSSLPVNADPKQNLLFGIGNGAARVFQALPLMYYWAWQCIILNPTYDDPLGPETVIRLQTILTQPYPQAENTNCVIVASATDPATHSYTRPLTESLSHVSPFIHVRFMKPTNTYYAMRPVRTLFDMTMAFQILACVFISRTLCNPTD